MWCWFNYIVLFGVFSLSTASTLNGVIDILEANDTVNLFAQSCSFSSDSQGFLFLGDRQNPGHSPMPALLGHLFKREGGNWTEVQVLQSPTWPDIRNQFGQRSDFGDGASLEWLIVGSYFAMDGGAFMYKRNGDTWEFKQDLLDQVSTKRFGYDVAMSGAYAVVGAPWHPQLGAGQGSAYVYRLDGETWTYTETLTELVSGSALAPNAQGYGNSVTISGDVIVVSAQAASFIYILTGGVWILAEELQVVSSQWQTTATDSFVAIGSPTEAGNLGAVYIYTRAIANWDKNQPARLAGIGVDEKYFGGGLMMVGTRLIVTSDTNAYVFDYDNSEQTWNQVSAFAHTARCMDEMNPVCISENGDRAVVVTGGVCYENAAFVLGEIASNSPSASPTPLPTPADESLSTGEIVAIASGIAALLGIPAVMGNYYQSISGCWNANLVPGPQNESMLSVDVKANEL